MSIIRLRRNGSLESCASSCGCRGGGDGGDGGVDGGDRSASRRRSLVDFGGLSAGPTGLSEVLLVRWPAAEAELPPVTRLVMVHSAARNILRLPK